MRQIDRAWNMTARVKAGKVVARKDPAKTALIRKRAVKKTGASAKKAPAKRAAASPVRFIPAGYAETRNVVRR